MRSLVPHRLCAAGSIASRSLKPTAVARDLHTTPHLTTDKPTDPAAAPLTPSPSPPANSDPSSELPATDLHTSTTGRVSFGRRLLSQRSRDAARAMQKAKREPLEVPPLCDLPDGFFKTNVHLHEPFTKAEWPMFEGPNWRSLQASWLQQYYNPHAVLGEVKDDNVEEDQKVFEDEEGYPVVAAEMPGGDGSDRATAEATVTVPENSEWDPADESALPFITHTVEPRMSTPKKSRLKSKVIKPSSTSANTRAENQPAFMPPKPSFDRYRLHFLLAEWSQGELKKALHRDLGAIERRTAVMSLSASYALCAWYVENNVPVPESLLKTIDTVRKAAPSYWGLDKPVAVTEEKPENFLRGEDVLDNEAVEAMSMPYHQSPSVFIPEMILQKQAFFPDKPNKSNPVSDILEVEKAVYAELHAPAPEGKRANGIQRPVTVIETAKYGGKRFSRSLVKHMATAIGADLVRVDAQDISRILGEFMGQDWVLSRGPFSLLGFRAAFLNGTLAMPGDLLNYLGYQDNTEQEPAQLAEMLFGAHSEDVAEDAFEEELMKIKEAPMGYLLSSTDRWGNLKIQAALERILQAANVKAGVPPEEAAPFILHIDDYVELSMTLEGALIIGRLRYMVDRMWLKGRKVVIVGSSSARQRSADYLRTLKEIATSDHLVPFKAEPRLALDYYEWAGSEKVDFLEQNCVNLRHVLRQLSQNDPVDHEWLEQQLPFSALHKYNQGLVTLREEYRWWSREAIKEPLKKLFSQLRADLGRDYDPIIGSGVVPFTELYTLARRILINARSPYAETTDRFSRIYEQMEAVSDPLSEAGKKSALSTEQQHQNVNSSNPNKSNGIGSGPGSSSGTSTQHMQVPKSRAESPHPSTPSAFAKPMSRGGRDRHSEPTGPVDAISQIPMSNFTDTEKKLLTGLVDASAIKTTFHDVHAPPATINALKLLTMLSLRRPEAFGYGVLARDRIPGCLLYGPPGTGKTLLAKAVAKESGAHMLEISGASINEMWVGQGEKNVAAVFSLAKKLAPLVIFIDEADALLASRGRSAGTTSHREVINEFLREWDGMSGTNAFIMVATNRPFDLDEAVLRRLPRKLLVDLPVEKDRKAILNILLRDEQLAPDVNTEELAKRCPLYSGSDLKNLCVAAAMKAVQEETEAHEKYLETSPPYAEPFQYPVRRTLTAAHFEVALKEIGASISDDMESMKGIRKFDEVHGSPGGKKKRRGMGFMSGDEKRMDAEDVKVRKEGDK